MNKKAGVPDGIFYLIAIFAVAIISIVGWLILSNINDKFQASSSISDQGKTMMTNIESRYVGIMDNAFLIILVGVLLGTVVGAWFIKTHPALFWIMIPIFAFIIFLAAIYANVFYSFMDNSKIAESVGDDDFVILRFIMSNYVYVITGVVILISIALFAKGRSEVM